MKTALKQKLKASRSVTENVLCLYQSIETPESANTGNGVALVHSAEPCLVYNESLC